MLRKLRGEEADKDEVWRSAWSVFKESEEHDCDTDIDQKRKILIVEMGEIVDDTYDGSSASNVGRVGHGQIHHSLLLPANHDVRSSSWIELKEAIDRPV